MIVASLGLVGFHRTAALRSCRLTERELEEAVPDIRPNPKRTILALLLIALVVILVALVALAIHSYFAPSPTFR